MPSRTQPHPPPQFHPETHCPNFKAPHKNCPCYETLGRHHQARKHPHDTPCHRSTPRHPKVVPRHPRLSSPTQTHVMIRVVRKSMLRAPAAMEMPKKLLLPRCQAVAQSCRVDLHSVQMCIDAYTTLASSQPPIATKLLNGCSPPGSPDEF
jgi:hypothetical protein